MTVDESSSQDATLIDDDLVAALGFEPLTSSEASNGRVEDTDVDPSAAASLGDTLVEDAVVDEPVVDEPVVDEPAADDLVVDDLVVDDREVESPADADGEADLDDVDLRNDAGLDVDEVVPDDAVGGAADVEVVADDAIAYEVILDEPSVDDAPGADNFFDEVGTDEVGTDEVGTDEAEAHSLIGSDNFFDDVDEEAATGTAVETDTEPETETETAEAESSSSGGSFFDLEDPGPNDEVLDEDTPLEAEQVAEAVTADATADDDDAEGATAGVAVIDIDLDEPSSAVIDLDLDPVSDRLADADEVFADVAVGDADIHPSTENLDLVGLEEGAALGAIAVAEVPADEAITAGAVAAAKPNKRRRRLRARKSRRVIRHIDPWSVLTFSVLFHMCVFAAMLLSSVLVWNAATASGMVENIESFIQELGDYETFEINADVMFKAAVVIAGMLTLASSVLVVLLTVVFNLISDLVGGIRVTVIEEETVRVPIDKKRPKAAVDQLGQPK